MYTTLLSLHSLFRWLVLIALLSSIVIALRGTLQKKPFTKRANHLRHWTATIGHIQLMIGIVLYFQSPVTQYFLKNFSKAVHHADSFFFGLLHLLLMFMAVVTLTIGSALAKRKPTDAAKYKTMLTWFGITLLIIFIAIPWPFSPLANRPYLRPF